MTQLTEKVGNNNGSTIIAGVEYLNNGTLTPMALSSGIPQQQSTGGAGRAVFLEYGNSTALGHALITAKTTPNGLVPAGSTVIPVTTDLTADGAVVAGSKLAIGLYSNGYFVAKLVSKTATNLTIDRPTPRLTHNNVNIDVFTGTRPTGIRTIGNMTGAWNALNGSPFELCPNFSFAGGKSYEMLPDFPAWLAFYKPAYVLLRLFENDLPISRTYAQCVQVLTSYLRICEAANVKAIVIAPYPSTGYTGATISGVYDQLVVYIKALSGNAIGVDPGNVWLDKTQVNNRYPLGTFSLDGVHLTATAYWAAGKILKGLLAGRVVTKVIPKSDLAFDYLPTSGTGGTVAGDTVATGTFAAGFTAVLYGAGTTLVGSKNALDQQVLTYTIPGASTNGATLFNFSTNSRTLAPTFGGQPVKAYVELVFGAATNLGSCWVQIDFNTGQGYAGFQVSPAFDSPDVAGQTMTLETPTVYAPEGATSYTLTFNCWPSTRISPSGVNTQVTIISFGLLPASGGEFASSLVPLVV